MYTDPPAHSDIHMHKHHRPRVTAEALKSLEGDVIEACIINSFTERMPLGCQDVQRKMNQSQDADTASAAQAGPANGLQAICPGHRGDAPMRPDGRPRNDTCTDWVITYRCNHDISGQTRCCFSNMNPDAMHDIVFPDWDFSRAPWRFKFAEHVTPRAVHSHRNQLCDTCKLKAQDEEKTLLIQRAISNDSLHKYLKRQIVYMHRHRWSWEAMDETRKRMHSRALDVAEQVKTSHPEWNNLIVLDANITRDLDTRGFERNHPPVCNGITNEYSFKAAPRVPLTLPYFKQDDFPPPPPRHSGELIQLE